MAFNVLLSSEDTGIMLDERQDNIHHNNRASPLCVQRSIYSCLAKQGVRRRNLDTSTFHFHLWA
jgi:hypothetical protein